MDARTIESLDQYNSVVCEHTRGMLYRGVCRSTFELIPSIGRYNYASMEELLRNEKDLMMLFKSQALPFLRSKPSNAWEWIALAQHHGLPTRLLDWTRNPLAALFFACSQEPENDGAVYFFSVTSHGLLYPDSKEDPFQLKEVTTVIPNTVASRIGVQSSLFTIHPDPTAPWEDKSTEKVIVPRRLKNQLLHSLEKFNIHKFSLFPDLDGLAYYLKWLKFEG